MDDTISRQAAINAFEDTTFTKNEIRRRLNDLPPSQLGWTTDVNDILAYLDGVVHPLVSPENWNVYSELHDMVSALPSAQPEYLRGRNINVDELIKILNPESNYVFYDDAHGFCINTQDVLDHLCAMPSAQPEQRWIPCTPETMPDRDGRYVCTYIHDGKKDVFMFRFEDGGWIVPWYVDAITAWYKPLDPWEG